MNCWVAANVRGMKYRHLDFPNNSHQNMPGWILPHNGKGFLTVNQTGFNIQNLGDSSWDFRTYPQTKLIMPLVAGQVYEIRLYVYTAYYIHPQNSGQFSFLKNFGIFFSNTRVSNLTSGSFVFHWPNQIDFSSYNFVPNTWNELVVNYTAVGGERYITLGNFDYFSEFMLYSGSPPLSPTGGSIAPLTIGIDDISIIPLGSTNTANPNANLGADTTICGTAVNMTLTAASGFDQYHWSTGDTTQSIQITQPGTYSVNVNDECSLCNDTIVVSLQAPLNLSIGNDTLLCVQNGFQLPITPNHNSFVSYLWSNGATTPTLLATSAGTYSLVANYACGDLHDTIVISTQQTPDSPLFVDTSICINSGDFQPTAVGTNVQWFVDTANLGSSVAPLFISTAADTFHIWLTQTVNTCESEKYPQSIVVVDLPYFTLPSDTTMCEFNDEKFGPRKSSWEYLWNDGYDKSPRIFENSGYYTLETKNDCGNYSQAIRVEIEECPCTVFFPEAISANGDGLNDFLNAAYFCDFQYYDLKVFNRWGQVVFKSQNPNDQWNMDTDFPQGIYQLVCIYKGKLTQEETVTQKLVVFR